MAGGYAVTGCAVGPYSLFGLAGIPTAHPVLVRSSRLVLAGRSSFSCFSVRPATLANLSVEGVSAGNAQDLRLDETHVEVVPILRVFRGSGLIQRARREQPDAVLAHLLPFLAPLRA